MTSGSAVLHTVRLDRLTSEPAGGKAAGLARLLELGLRVPPGFVLYGDLSSLVEADSEGEALVWEPALRAYRDMGEGPVAVRSSVEGEDGAIASFAGQYESVLGVVGEAALLEAIGRCARSARAARAKAYRAGGRGAEADDTAAAVSVVVQRMVEARAAGVVFTVDPVTGRRDRVVVDAARGLGEDLMSGHLRPDHFELDLSGRLVVRQAGRDGETIDEREAAAIALQALRVAEREGHPMDMEWALDADGRLCWLQARPVTALGADPRELDTICSSEDVLTRGNTGEMMPGAMCPLTISSTGRGIDHGTQNLMLRTGGMREPQPTPYTVSYFFGHIFFNLSHLREMADRVAGSSVHMLALAICGQAVPELGPPRPAPWYVRAVNGVRYSWYVLSWRRSLRRLERHLEGLKIEPGGTAEETWKRLDQALDLLDWTYAVHMQSSAGSGLSSGVLAQVLARRAPQTGSGEEAELARLLARASGVVSAELVFALDELAMAIAAAPGGGAAFAGAAVKEALVWLRGDESGEAGALFERFLERHGHRSFRELDMRQPCWEDSPDPLVRALQASVRALSRAGGHRPGGPTVAGGDTEGGLAGGSDFNGGTDVIEGSQDGPPGGGLLLRWLVAWARQTVRNREHTKDMLVRVTNSIKRVYRRLGEQMTREGSLPDPDAVFFLTHQELGQQARDGSRELGELALARRETFEYQQRLELPFISVGPPEPVGRSETSAVTDDVLRGKPVSGGVVDGPVRVARNLEDAEAAQAGEILVAPVTDVGWTPYFRILGGLVTEVGSAISHGAVVAREYGLPAVVNVPDATCSLRSGMLVRLDGYAGTVTVLELSPVAAAAEDELSTSPPRRRAERAALSGSNQMTASQQEKPC